MRRSFNNNTTFTAAAMASSPLAVAARRNVVCFTHHNDVLQNNAKHLKFNSPVWVQDTDAFWTSKLSDLKPGARPTEVMACRMQDFYNLDCCAKSPEALEQQLKKIIDDETASAGAATEDQQQQQHKLFVSKASFGKRVAADLDEAACTRGYTSKFWLTSAQVRSNNIALKRGAKVTNVIVQSPGKFFNADQFEHPDKISKAPISGYKLQPFAGEVARALALDVADKKYPTGLYFSIGQLELFRLTDHLDPDATPVEVDVFFSIDESASPQPSHNNNDGNNNNNDSGNVSREGGNNNNNNNNNNNHHQLSKLYCLDEVEHSEALLESMMRFPVAVPTMLVSGKAITLPSALRQVSDSAEQQQQQQQEQQQQQQDDKSATTTRSMYFASKHEIESRGFKLLPTAVGIDPNNATTKTSAEPKEPKKKMKQTLVFFNVHQLSNADVGFQIAGTKTVL